MKKIILILSVALTVLVFASCASITYSPNTFYTSGTVSLAKRAEATNTIWLGFFGEGTYPLAEEVAKGNGINRLASVEHYYKVGLFALWIDYTTVVTGE